MEEIYKKYPEVVAIIGIKDGIVYLDTDDTKLSITELMVVINKFTQEYLEVIATQSANKNKEQ